MSKYFLITIVFLLLLDCVSTIGLFLSLKDKPIEREGYQLFKVVKIPNDTVYVDPITIGTTTDPEY